MRPLLLHGSFHVSFPGNLIFGPITAALAPPAGNFHVLPASDAGYFVLPGLFQFEEAGQTEFALHSFTPSGSVESPLRSGRFSNAGQRQPEVLAALPPGWQSSQQLQRRHPKRNGRALHPRSRIQVQCQRAYSVPPRSLSIRFVLRNLGKCSCFRLPLDHFAIFGADSQLVSAVVDEVNFFIADPV